jgi:hypothetical protein
MKMSAKYIRGEIMLTLGSRARYHGHDCIVVGRTLEAHSRYDLLFPVSRRIEQNVPEKDLEPCSTEPLLQLTGSSLQMEKPLY